MLEPTAPSGSGQLSVNEVPGISRTTCNISYNSCNKFNATLYLDIFANDFMVFNFNFYPCKVMHGDLQFNLLFKGEDTLFVSYRNIKGRINYEAHKIVPLLNCFKGNIISLAACMFEAASYIDKTKGAKLPKKILHFLYETINRALMSKQMLEGPDFLKVAEALLIINEDLLAIIPRSTPSTQQ